MYVDLDRLLPRDHAGMFDPLSQGDEDRLEWVRCDGGTFLEPARKTTKITNFRRWEQAFRVYAMIYCGSNPGRSREVWQYISVINTAATVYTWENVSAYDVVFRQLMEFNPGRSWAVTYNQMWNLTMRDPIQKFSSRGSAPAVAQSGAPGGKRGGYCWNFNRGVKCKYGSKCKYKERCSYCDAVNHELNVCPKLSADKKDQGGGGWKFSPSPSASASSSGTKKA